MTGSRTKAGKLGRTWRHDARGHPIDLRVSTRLGQQEWRRQTQKQADEVNTPHENLPSHLGSGRKGPARLPIRGEFRGESRTGRIVLPSRLAVNDRLDGSFKCAERFLQLPASCSCRNLWHSWMNHQSARCAPRRINVYCPINTSAYAVYFYSD
jgi:hypothetical protein